MCHVHHHVRPDLVADGAEALVVPVARVRRAAADDELRLEEHGLLLKLVVVDEARVDVQAVRERLKIDRRRRDALLGGVEAVGEVAAVGQVKAHDAVVGLEEAGVHSEVGGGARVRLHIATPLTLVETEGLQRPGLAEALDLVDVLVASIVARTGLALRVLVGEHAAVALHHRLRREVLHMPQRAGEDH